MASSMTCQSSKMTERKLASYLQYSHVINENKTGIISIHAKYLVSYVGKTERMTELDKTSCINEIKVGIKVCISLYFEVTTFFYLFAHSDNY